MAFVRTEREMKVEKCEERFKGGGGLSKNKKRTTVQGMSL